jgi:hypothetical protein
VQAAAGARVTRKGAAASVVVAAAAPQVSMHCVRWQSQAPAAQQPSSPSGCSAAFLSQWLLSSLPLPVAAAACSSTAQNTCTLLRTTALHSQYHTMGYMVTACCTLPCCSWCCCRSTSAACAS